MKETRTILCRVITTFERRKSLGMVGQAFRLPSKNQASQARRLRCIGRAQSYAGWFKVTGSRGRHIYTKLNMEWITG